MARTIEFREEHEYREEQTSEGVVWRPEINAEFRTKAGRVRRGRALVDSGADLCAMPKDVAVGYLGIDLGSCRLQRTQGINGPPIDIPYTTMHVRAFGLESDCKVLLMESNLYLVGRVPFFSMVELGFHEEADGTNNRILYTKK